MGGTYTKKDLKLAREIGINDVIMFLESEKLDSISELGAVVLAHELLMKKEEIVGYANKLIKSTTVPQGELQDSST